MVEHVGWKKGSMPNSSFLGSLEVSLKLYKLLVRWTAGRPAVGEIKNKAKLSPAKLSFGFG